MLWIGAYDLRGRLRQTFAPFWEAWRLVKERYVEPQAAQDVAMTRGAITGMLASLGRAEPSP